jgi:hypothetical protein
VDVFPVAVEHEAGLHTAFGTVLRRRGGKIFGEKELQCTCYFLSSVQTTGHIGKNEE